MPYTPAPGRRVRHRDPEMHKMYGLGTVLGTRERRPGSRVPTDKTVLVRWDNLLGGRGGVRHDPTRWVCPRDIRVLRWKGKGKPVRREPFYQN